MLLGFILGFFLCAFFFFFSFFAAESFVVVFILGPLSAVVGAFLVFSSLCWFLGNEAFSSRPAFLTENRYRWWRPLSEESLTRSSSLGSLRGTWSSSTSGSLQVCRPLDRFHWLFESVSRRLWPGCSAPSASSPTRRIVLRRPQRTHLASESPPYSASVL